MTIRRQSKTPRTSNGRGVPFASGMEQIAIAMGSPMAFGAIGARNAGVIPADRQACRRGFAPVGEREFNAPHGLAAQPAGGGTEPARRLDSVAVAAPSMPVSTHVAPTGADVGKGRVARLQGAPGRVPRFTPGIHNAQNHAQAWA